MINNNDFAFDAGQSDFKKKRKMEIEDEVSPYQQRHQQEEPMEEELNDLSS
jgi:Zn-finger domain-containing protein